MIMYSCFVRTGSPYTIRARQRSTEVPQIAFVKFMLVNLLSFFKMSEKCLSLISKPHLVDLLRHFDKMQVICPRIRYASVRSKPELISDICQVFKIKRNLALINFVPKHLKGFPEVQYDLGNRRYLFDSLPLDIPKISREKPKFQIRPGPYVLHWECYR